jgi:hypothetical protein
MTLTHDTFSGAGEKRMCKAMIRVRRNDNQIEAFLGRCSAYEWQEIGKVR